MCDPVTATMAALTLGGTALGTKHQYDVARGQERANAQANAVSLAAQQDERQRQQQFTSEQTTGWETTREGLSREQHDAARQEAALSMLQQVDDMGSASTGPMDFISTQDRASNEVRDTIARQTGQAAARTRQQIEAMANLNAYGPAAQQRGISMAQNQDLMGVLQGLQRGSLNASQFEQNIPAARYSANPWTSGLSEVMTGLGQAGLGYAGQQSVMGGSKAATSAASMGRIY